jgi:hypothetical protein
MDIRRLFNLVMSVLQSKEYQNEEKKKGLYPYQ